MALPEQLVRLSHQQAKRYAESDVDRLWRTSAPWSSYNSMLPFKGLTPEEWVIYYITENRRQNQNAIIVDLGAMDGQALTGIWRNLYYERIFPHKRPIKSKLFEYRTRGLFDALYERGLFHGFNLYAFNGGEDMGDLARSRGVIYSYGDMLSDFDSFVPKGGADIIFSRYTLYQSPFQLEALQIVNKCLREPDDSLPGGLAITERALDAETSIDENLIFTPDGKQIPIKTFFHILRDICGWDLEFSVDGYIDLAWARKKDLARLPITLKRVYLEKYGALEEPFLRPEYVIDDGVSQKITEAGLEWQESRWFRARPMDNGRAIVEMLWENPAMK